MRVLSSLLLLSALFAAAVPPAPAQQAPPAQPTPAKEDLVAAAAKVARHSKQLSQIWPSYWPEDQAFILNVAGIGALLVSPGPRPSGFEPIGEADLPPELKGRAYFQAGNLAGAERPFVIGYPIGEGRTAMLVNLRGDDPDQAIMTLLHEQFHGYQNPAFKGREQQFVDPLAVKDRVAFAASAEVERTILAAAVSAATEGERRELLRQYFALRRERERTVPPEAVKVEQGFERIEGTAKYIDRRALSAFSRGGEAALRRLLQEELRRPLGAHTGAYSTIWFRTRGYSTGAALTYLVSHYDRGDWRSKIEAGAKPDELLESLVGKVPGAEAGRLAEQARTRFGYAAKRLQLEPLIREAEKKEIKSVAEFLALDAYHVVFDAGARGGGVKPGFSAINMTPLGQNRMALPKAMMLAVPGDTFMLTAKDRPALIDGIRFTVLLPAAPKLAGGAALTPGEHRLDKLRLTSDGYELRVDAPVVVTVEPNRMVVRLVD
jgi:hypothetical protein